mmetsp:Transcript_17753/g.38849  ORF Transcript_17753/g.38849 Transcript_17753/m.38849 type:complete len:204 (-) Transcript_17753:369-980(-)
MVADSHAGWWRLVPPVRSVGIVCGVGTIVGVVLVGSLNGELPVMLLLLSGSLGGGMIIIIQPVAVISSTGRRILDVAIPGSGRTSSRLGSVFSATMLLAVTSIIFSTISTSQVNGGTILSGGMRLVLLVVRAVHRWRISGIRMIGSSSRRRRRSRDTAVTTTIGSSSSSSVVLRGRRAVTAGGIVRMVLMLMLLLVMMMMSVR